MRVRSGQVMRMPWSACRTESSPAGAEVGSCRPPGTWLRVAALACCGLPAATLGAQLEGGPRPDVRAPEDGRAPGGAQSGSPPPGASVPPRDAAGAIRALERAAALERDAPGPHFDLGVLYASGGRFEEAAGVLRRGLELEPGNRTARYNYARVLLAMGRTGAAIEELERLAEAVPGDSDVSLSLIEAWMKAGDRARAVESALALAETVADGRTLAAIGGVLARSGELEAAGEVLAEALDAWPEEPALWLELARLRQRRGDHERAVLAAERAAGLAPERAEVVLGYAETLITARRQEQARDYLLPLGSRFGGHPGYPYTLGVALFGLHHYLESAAAFERAVALDPSWGTAHFLLGTSWLAAGEARRAAEAYLRATEADPGNPLGFVYLARAYGGMGPEFDGAAVEAARQALRLDPNNVECLTRVARHSLEVGLLGEARALLERVIGNHPDVIKPRILLARAYYRSGMPSEAAAQERRIRALQAAQQARDTARGDAARTVPSPGYGLGTLEIP